MLKRTAWYLLLDRSDPTNARWVIAQAVVSLPAEFPDGLAGPGPAWLSKFGHDQFTCLADYLDHPGGVGVRVPDEVRGCFATRLVGWDDALLEHDRHGLGWYDGWDGVVHDTWVDPDHVPDNLDYPGEPRDGEEED